MSRLIRLEGNTYDVKDRLKALGCVKDPTSEKFAWACPEHLLEQARAIIAAGPQPGDKPPERKEYRPTRCRECGARPSRYVRIYRNGKCGPCIGDDKAERHAD